MAYKICVVCEEEADISYLSKDYCSKHYLEKLINEKCSMCKKKSEINDYCFEHYVEKEPQECLYWDFESIVRQLNWDEIIREAENNELLAEIIKKHPQFIERYKDSLNDTKVTMATSSKKFNESIK